MEKSNRPGFAIFNKLAEELNEILVQNRELIHASKRFN